MITILIISAFVVTIIAILFILAVIVGKGIKKAQHTEPNDEIIKDGIKWGEIRP